METLGREKTLKNQPKIIKLYPCVRAKIPGIKCAKVICINIPHLITG